jgi:hypothetical protein
MRQLTTIGLALALGCSADAWAGMVITGVIDGPLPDGLPKALELYVIGDIPDLSIFGLGSANNGGGSDGEEFTFPADTATAGQFIHVAYESDGFFEWFGFDPDYTTGALNINGDDAIELFMNGEVIDVFGEIDVDGTGQPWEYLDGWAYRIDQTGPDGSVFVLDNWYFSGPNALDGETSNDTAETPFPTGTYSPFQDPNDIDGDGIPNDEDNCPEDYNPGQEDLDEDGQGDVCDPDIDGDGWLNGEDNCPYTYNPGQEDSDGDGIGDACDTSWVINEILADPAPGDEGDANGDGMTDSGDDEFIEIYNDTGGPMDISGWEIHDAAQGVGHVFPDPTIIEDQCVVVVFGGGTPTGFFGGAVVQTSSEGYLSLNNAGDTVTLYDDQGVEVVSYTYGSEGNQNESLTRDPDVVGPDPLVLHSTAQGAVGIFSPGTLVDGSFFPGCAGGEDGDGDGIPDDFDNCPENYNPDQEDCDNDGVGDVCTIEDCPGDPWCSDCNENGIPDGCDIDDEFSQDCNSNDIPDECDLANGVLHDENGNGYPDECEIIPPDNLVINEIRIDQPGADDDEYFELKGDPMTSLLQMRYLVIGDGDPDDGSGVIEEIVNLDGWMIRNDGYFVAAEDTYTLGNILDDVDLILSSSDNELNFENSDNVTHVLVGNFFGHRGQDLDVDDDGEFDGGFVPWLHTIDMVALVENLDEPPTNTEWWYGDVTVGPDDMSVPGHVYRCEPDGTWLIGPFDPAEGGDTVHDDNPECPEPECPWDFDGDGDVDTADLLHLLGAWGTPDGDVDGDGDTDTADLLALLAHWGLCPE